MFYYHAFTSLLRFHSELFRDAHVIYPLVAGVGAARHLLGFPGATEQSCRSRAGCVCNEHPNTAYSDPPCTVTSVLNQLYLVSGPYILTQCPVN